VTAGLPGGARFAWKLDEIELGGDAQAAFNPDEPRDDRGRWGHGGGGETGRTVTLYHGTAERNLAAIHRDGLKPPPEVAFPEAYPMLTTDQEGAAGFAGHRGGAPVVVTYKLTPAEAAEHLKDHGPAVGGHRVYSIKKPLPARMIAGIAKPGAT
jgi:hypothetical protein